MKLARELGPGHKIVTVLCDSGTRHLSKFWATTRGVDSKNDGTLDAIIGP